jgi:capsule polysaccharide export protein KpsE/RkpR
MLPPQQQQGLAATLLGTLAGGLAGGAAGGLGGLKNPADQWVSFFHSRTITDRLIDKFGLVEHYDVKFRFEAAKVLDRKTDVAAGKDGIITVAVSADDPATAKAMATEYAKAIDDLNDRLALTDAGQRRLFFEQEVKRATVDLNKAQAALTLSGVPLNSIKIDPMAAVAAVADLKAQISIEEIKLQVAEQRLAENNPELLDLKQAISALKGQLAKLEGKEVKAGDESYVDAFREFKYREGVFEMLTKQFELAKLDEAREGSVVQIIDSPDLPEWKSFPKRALFAALGAAIGLFAAIASVFLGNVMRSVREVNRSQAA